jgi:hypothetical protein
VAGRQEAHRYRQLLFGFVEVPQLAQTIAFYRAHMAHYVDAPLHAPQESHP